MKNTLTPAKAADLIGCGKSHVYDMINSGVLLARKIGTGEFDHWRVVVRRTEFDPPRTGNFFLTIQEYIQSKSNQTK